MTTTEPSRRVLQCGTDVTTGLWNDIAEAASRTCFGREGAPSSSLCV